MTPQLRASLAKQENVDLVQADKCAPLHGVRDDALRDQIAESMRRDGWDGRPLIGYKDDDAHYQLLTGSHRWAAAIAAGLAEIPVRLLSAAELDALPLDRYAIINAEDAVPALRDADMLALARLWEQDAQ
jgi:ParB-like chromosome segregation protein Spo0J